jgi:hypothetical protein
MGALIIFSRARGAFMGVFGAMEFHVGVLDLRRERAKFRIGSM